MVFPVSISGNSIPPVTEANGSTALFLSYPTSKWSADPVDALQYRCRTHHLSLCPPLPPSSTRTVIPCWDYCDNFLTGLPPPLLATVSPFSKAARVARVIPLIAKLDQVTPLFKILCCSHLMRVTAKVPSLSLQPKVEDN